MNSLSAHYSEADLRGLNQTRRRPNRLQTTDLNYNRGCWSAHRGSDRHRNLPNRSFGSWRTRSPFIPGAKRGASFNLNKKNGQGRDRVMVFDMNRDGPTGTGDVFDINDMMKAVSGNYDFDGDGRVTRYERIRGQLLRQNFLRLDRDRNGRLDSWEVSRGGGKVWVDRSRNRRLSKREVQSPYRIPDRFGNCSGDSVSPFFGSRTSSNRPWWQPFPMMPLYR